MKPNLARFPGLKTSYEQYVVNYKQFLKLRGFGEHVNDWPFVKRGFLEPWAQPGFHRFWQTWNPGIGFFAYRIYLFCGGEERRNWATIAAFLVNGLIHNLVVSLFIWRWDFPLPFTFTLFGFLTIVSRWLDGHMNMSRWPKLLHLAINAGLVMLSFDFGFRMNDILQALLFFGSWK
jgi:hypothetical protein